MGFDPIQANFIVWIPNPYFTLLLPTAPTLPPHWDQHPGTIVSGKRLRTCIHFSMLALGAAIWNYMVVLTLLLIGIS